MGESPFRWLAVEAEGKHQVRDGERRDNGKLARLSCKPKPYERARKQRVPHPALTRHPDHEVQSGDSEHRLERIHREEVAELNVYDSKRSQERSKQARPAVERQRSDPIHCEDGCDIRQA